MTSRTIWLVVAVTVCSSCATHRVDDEYGTAVKQMMAAQVYDRATLSGKHDRPVIGMDPESASGALDSMRKDTPTREEVKRDLLINVGQTSGGAQ